MLGAIYNRVLLDALDIADGLKRIPVELRAGLIGAAVGALAWFAPGLVGGGDLMTQSLLSGATPFALLPLLFAIRLFLSCASYAAGTPGGLFAPLLLLGAQMGFFFGALFYPDLPAPNVHAILFAVVGMAALFSAVVRAPLTGMILVTEMTGNSIELLPMLAACFAAMALATLLGGAPVYDWLKERALRLAREGAMEKKRRARFRSPHKESTMKATLATAMTIAATTPPAVICHGSTNSAMIFRLVAISSIAAIIGAARTPLRTALQ